jgi:5-formyltetrahydrofolate cyclo-ligase
MKTSRSSLRRSLLQHRMFADADARHTWDQRIIGHLRRHLLQQPARRIGAYWPIRNEPDLRELLAELVQAGFEIGLPEVVATHAPLRFLRWTPDAALSAAAFGVPVPATAIPLRPELLLVPCVGFFTDEKVDGRADNHASRSGRHFRLGYGGGYYDRTLAAHPMPAIGVAYECSRTTAGDDFEPEAHDVPLTAVVTEKGMSGP